MPLYNCDLCNISTKIKTHYNRHLLTAKHKKNKEKYDNEQKKSIFSPPNTSKYLRSIPPNTSEYLQIPPNTSGCNSDISIFPEKSQFQESKFKCDYCEKSFSRIDNLNRHMNKRCQKAKDHISYKELFIETKKQMQEEKEEFKKQIELLLTKVGNTTTHINNTQNIQLNSYGNEDMSHITDSLKSELLKIPYGMIPKMIEAVHFNNLKPENKNIAFTNKKDNKIKVFAGDKWIYKDKDATINDLIDGKYFILDTHYENKLSEDMSVSNKSTYEQFRTFFDEKDKELHEQLKRDCELVLLNNR